MTWVGWGWGWGGGGGYSRMFEFVRAVAWLIKSAFFGLGNCSVFLKATICGMKTMSNRKVCTMYIHTAGTKFW